MSVVDGLPQPSVPEADEAALLSRLADWGAVGSSGPGPMRLAYLQALAGRMQAQSGALRVHLRERLRAALDQNSAGSGLVRTPLAERGPSPLAALNRYIEAQAARRAAAGDGAAPQREAGLAGPRADLPSVTRFRAFWAQHHAEERLRRAAARRPENAGPLNSHTLVLHSLDLMQQLSPDYLRHFLAHVEALQWIEQAQEKAVPAARAPRRSRPRK